MFLVFIVCDAQIVSELSIPTVVATGTVLCSLFVEHFTYNKRVKLTIVHHTQPISFPTKASTVHVFSSFFVMNFY